MTDRPVPSVRLAGGLDLPVLGLGTWRMTDAEAERAVVDAVGCGWRLVDTAYLYQNEAGVGRGIRACGLRRDQVLVASKLNGEWHGRAEARQALTASLGRLGLDHLDLYLIHWPLPWQDRYAEAWQGLIDLRAEGLTRAIGVSNFKPAHLDRLIAETGVAPEINQIQLDPTMARGEVRAYHAEHGIVTQSWRPLGRPNPVLDHPTVLDLAERYGRQPAQIVLRWHLQQGLTAVVKSVRPERLAANIDVFDFELTGADLAAMAELDRGESGVVDSDTTGN